MFGDERVVVDAGIMLAVALGSASGLSSSWIRRIGLVIARERRGRGLKVLSLVHAMLLGAVCIDDCQVLRAGRTAAVLGHRPMAASTLGTFLRAVTFGHVRQLDRVLALALGRAWRAGAAPMTSGW